MFTLACATWASAVAGESPEAFWREVAPADGWAAQEGGTQGGAAAPAARVFRVRDIAALRAALGDRDGAPRIVVLEGVIDATGGVPFADHADQSRRGQLRVPSRTTLVGRGGDAGLVNVNLVLKGVDDVILRNFAIQTPWDAFPVWDPEDGPHGHWNSEYDGITVDASRHVWIDRVLITDAPRTDDQNGHANGQEVQHHDGALDLKNGADFVTVSWSIFRLHDKNNLVGHSDSRESDAGHLRASFHHNLFDNIVQRAPRVRYGQVHLYSNLHVGSRTHAVYPHQYSHGVGVGASMISEANRFEIEGATTACDIVKTFGGTRYEDRGSLLNGRALTLDCPRLSGLGPAGWTPPYAYAPTPLDELAASLRAGAGPH